MDFLNTSRSLKCRHYLKQIKKLNKNGYFVASFRNRLFNIFSLNKFTSNELKLKER